MPTKGRQPRKNRQGAQDTRSGPLVVIVGPTAVGKTTLAVRLGQTFGGEVVSADSRQIYRLMDIGTAKPDQEERRLVPHHLIDMVEPDQGLTLAQYQELAYAAINDILERGRLPLLVGGTGLYVKAVIEGYTVPPIPPDETFRARLYKEAEESGVEALHARLQEVDPVAATKINPHNLRRVVRALEVYQATQQPISELQQKRPPRYEVLQIGLTMEREKLYRRIDRRVDRMMEEGLVEEVRSLVERGYALSLPAMSGLGYRQIGLYLQGMVDLKEAVRSIKTETHRFVRHQYTWFRLDDGSIHWFNADDEPFAQVERLVGDFLQRLG